MNRPSIPSVAYEAAIKTVQPIPLGLALNLLYALASRRCKYGKYNRLKRDVGGSWYVMYTPTFEFTHFELEKKPALRVAFDSSRSREQITDLVVQGDGTKCLEIEFEFDEIEDCNPFALVSKLYDIEIEKFALSIHGAEVVNGRWEPFVRCEMEVGSFFDELRDEILKGLRKEELSDFSGFEIKSIPSEIKEDVGYDPDSIEYKSTLLIEKTAGTILDKAFRFGQLTEYLVAESDLAELAYRIAKATLSGCKDIIRDENGQWLAQFEESSSVIYFDQTTPLCVSSEPIKDFFEKG